MSAAVAAEGRDDVAEDRSGFGTGSNNSSRFGSNLGTIYTHGITLVESCDDADFDDNPTEIFLAVHERMWNEVNRICERNPEEASIWMSRRNETNGSLGWRALPLHGAIIFQAPVKTISTLLAAYPESAASTDDRGMLPIHLALTCNATVECVKLILQAFPECSDRPDEKGRVPLVLAKTIKTLNRRQYVHACADALHKAYGECDFDTNPTKLYQYLQKKMWTRGVDDLLNERDLMTYVSRRELDGRLRWRMLPLTAAIIFGAPVPTIEKVLRAYPKTAGLTDDRNMLPQP